MDEFPVPRILLDYKKPAEDSIPGMLLVFDFDNTLVDGNTDLEIIRLEKKWVLNNQDENPQGWSHRMTSALQTVHSHNVERPDINKLMTGIPLIPGCDVVIQVLEKLKNDGRHYIAICSHANTYFIEVILNHHNMKHLFHSIHTFEASWLENGSLAVKPYHLCSTGCTLCPVDFCKGLFLRNLKQAFAENGVEFSCVVYVGDGVPDYCAGLSLGLGDFLLYREGFTMHKHIVGQRSPSMRAQCLPWKTGHDIASFLESLRYRIGSEALKI